MAAFRLDLIGRYLKPHRRKVMLGAIAHDALYLVLGSLFFLAMFERARRDGQLLDTGE